YWLDLIVAYCNREQIRLIATPIPFEGQVVALYREGHYPGAVANIGSWSTLSYCNPLDDFIEEFLRLKVEGEKNGHPVSGCPLFNDRINDPHFSAKGAEVWGRALGRRVGLLLEMEQLRH